MGVDAAGGIQHLALGLTTQRPQGREGLGRGLFRRLAARPGAGFKIGVERRSAVHEGEHIHVPVASAVAPVHKAGLWGGGHFVEQGADGQTGRVGDVLRVPGLGQDLRRLFLQFGHGMDAAAAAHLSRPAADETAAAFEV